MNKRVKITLIFSVIIAVLASASFLKYRLDAFAPIDNELLAVGESSTQDQDIVIPDSLADELEATGFDPETPTGKAVQGLIDASLKTRAAAVPTEVKDVESGESSDETRHLDQLIILTRANGERITPDLKQSVGRGVTGCPNDSNTLTFKLSKEWSADQSKVILETISTYLPRLREVFGPPLFNISISVEKLAENGLVGGTYSPATNQLRLMAYSNNDYIRETLIHELSHAWRDDLLMNFRGHEEGLAEYTVAISLFPPRGSLYSSLVDQGIPIYIPSLASNSYYNSWVPYRLGSEAYGRIGLSDFSFFKKFHCKLFETKATSKPDIDLAFNNSFNHSGTTIEGVLASTWYKSIAIFHPKQGNGAGFTISPAGFRDFGLGDFKNNSVTWLANKPVTVTYYDFAGKQLGQIICKTGSGRQEGYNINEYREGQFNFSYCPKGEELGQPLKNINYQGVVKVKIVYDKLNFNFFYPMKIEFYKDYMDNISFVKPLSPTIFLKHELKAGKLVLEETNNHIKVDLNIINGVATEAKSIEDANYLAYIQKYRRVAVHYSCPDYKSTDIKLAEKNMMSPSPIAVSVPGYKSSNSVKTTRIGKTYQWQVSPANSSHLVADILDSGGKTIRKLTTGIKINAGNNNFPSPAWDLKDDNGKTVPAGTYTLKVNVTDQFCNKASANSSFVISR